MRGADQEVEGWVTSYAAIAAREMDVESNTVGELAGHPTMGLVGFLRRYPESYWHLVRTQPQEPTPTPSPSMDELAGDPL